MATDLALPGATPEQKPNLPFLMYPVTFIAKGQPDSLDPASFRYEMTARELAA